jgi:hypothetical protein
MMRTHCEPAGVVRSFGILLEVEDLLEEVLQDPIRRRSATLCAARRLPCADAVGRGSPILRVHRRRCPALAAAAGGLA